MNPSDRPVHFGPISNLAASDDAVSTARVRIIAWCVLVLAGLIEAIFSRCAVWADGISYLDMGDAMMRGDWKMAISVYWSPLYPFLQGLALRLTKPSAYSEFAVVYVVNFVIYLFALGCFDFLLRAATEAWPHRDGISDGDNRLPRWAVFALGYSVFLWSSLTLITMQSPTPDILMAGLLYLAVGLLLRLWAQPRGFSLFVALGAVLGFGYLAKAAVFPLAFLFFVISWGLSGSWRQAVPRVLVALVAFFAVSGPWIAALSHAAGHLTFGDTGRFNYVREVNHASPNPYFQNPGTGSGHLVHPVRKLFDNPPIYEFATPIKGTLPVWYDPSYWTEGAAPRVSLKQELLVVHRWLMFYFDMLFPNQAALFVSFVVLWLIAGQHLALQQMAARWPVWLIGLAGLAMYALVFVEPRYVAGFFTLLWVGLFSGLRMPSVRESRRLVSIVTLAVVIATVSPTAVSIAGDLTRIVKGQPHNQFQVAEDLRELGVVPGDRVARIGGLFNVGWARLLRVTIVADIPRTDWREFWCAKPEVQAQVIETFRRLGATAIVAEQTPGNTVYSPGPEWHRLGDGTFYAMKISPQSEKQDANGP